MSINLAEKASAKLSESFTLSSCTEGLFSQKYDWTGVATVKVYTLDNLQLNDYQRSPRRTASAYSRNSATQCRR